MLLSSLLAPVHVEGCLCSVVNPPLPHELDDRDLSKIAGILVRRCCAHAPSPGAAHFSVARALPNLRGCFSSAAS